MNPGSGYAFAPKVAILDGTRADPIRPGGSGAEVSATIDDHRRQDGHLRLRLHRSHRDHCRHPAGTGAGAMASATVETGAITGITVTNPGSGYVTPGGMRKFIDPLPGMCDPAGVAAPACPTDGSKYIPLAVPDTTTYTDADTYEIALVQFRMSYSSDLKDPITGDPVGTLTRGYVQIDTGGVPGSQQVPLMNELLDGDLSEYRLHWGDTTAVPRADHRRHQGQAGAHRLPQPAADRLGRRPLPAGGHDRHGLRAWPGRSTRYGGQRHRHRR